jgi:hypothetical protein
MWRERLAVAERLGWDVVCSSLTALRILVDHWDWPWAQRRFLGERAGVWVLGMVWLALPVAVAAFVL